MAVAHATTPFVTIYTVTGWVKIADPASLPAGEANGVRFSPDGKKLAVAHTTAPCVTVYTVASWLSETLSGLSTGSNGVAFKT